MNWKKTLLICLIILLVAAGITYIIFSTEPTAKREGATKETAMLVEVIEVERDTFQPVIQVTGTVQPSQDITLSPRVEGEIIWRSDDFVPGGIVRKGQTLVKIDPSDYEIALKMRESELGQAMADLEIEKGRQDIAEQDYALVDKVFPADKKALALRKPQLEAVKASVESAQAALDQAQLLVDRTTVKAPFDARIVSRETNKGSLVAPGDPLGRLVGVNTYWVVASVPLGQLRWLTFPDGNETHGSGVRIQNRSAWPPDDYRTGTLFKTLGVLDEKTRLASVIVTVPDPLNLHQRGEELPTLTLGAFVQARIQGREIPDVVRLKRDFLRKDDTVWVMQDGELQIRQIDIVFRGASFVYIRAGLEQGDKVVTTNLSTVVEGAPLRTANSINTTPDTMQSNWEN